MSKNNSDSAGVSLGLTFIVLGIVVQFAFLNYELALWIATFLISIGIASLGIEVGKNSYRSGFKDMGVGIFFFLPSFLGVFYFSYMPLRILLTLPLMIGIFGTIKGLLDQLDIINTTTEENHKKEIVKVNTTRKLELLFSVVGFVSNILTILAYFIK